MRSILRKCFCWHGKCSIFTKAVTRKKFFYYLLILGSLIFFLHPDRNARSKNYNFIRKDEIWDELVLATSPNISAYDNLICNYASLLDDEASSGHLYGKELNEDASNIKLGGEFIPEDCLPAFSTAIIVPYRDRTEQLRNFLIYMHSFLRKQKIHYRIYVVEQVNNNLFNRAQLLNIGAVYAMRDGFPCLILHDVDLIPLKANNIYACTKEPRHMSSSIDKFRYVLPYLHLFGGAVAILSSQFKQINGMSNSYVGWGAEDDDFYERIKTASLSFCRFDPDISTYTMVKHKPQIKAQNRSALLKDAVTRIDKDGLNSLKYIELAKSLHSLFTHIMVDFD